MNWHIATTYIYRRTITRCASKRIGGSSFSYSVTIKACQHWQGSDIRLIVKAERYCDTTEVEKDISCQRLRRNPAHRFWFQRVKTVPHWPGISTVADLVSFAKEC